MYAIATVLRLSDEYTIDRLRWMTDIIRKKNPGARIICLTDAPSLPDGIEREPLLHDWPGWWAKIEIFRPDLFHGTPVLYMDIDTIVLRNLDAMMAAWMKKTGGRMTMLRDVYRRGACGSGVMAFQDINHGIYHRFRTNSRKIMAEYRTTRKWGDQAYIQDSLRNFPQQFGDECVSYKAHVRQSGKIPESASIMYFHGKPRPWNVERFW